MQPIKTIEELEALYGAISPNALSKVTEVITPLYRQWIEACRFAVLATAAQDGTDASPRGDNGPVVRVADQKTLMLPDWQGNNRLDSFRNILRDDKVSMMFLVPGCLNVVRVNGTAILTADEQLRASFAKGDKLPRLVVVITVDEAYFQCASALLRSRLWKSDDESKLVPTAGDFLKESKPEFDGRSYDEGYSDNAKPLIW